MCMRKISYSTVCCVIYTHSTVCGVLRRLVRLASSTSKYVCTSYNIAFTGCKLGREQQRTAAADKTTYKHTNRIENNQNDDAAQLSVPHKTGNSQQVNVQ